MYADERGVKETDYYCSTSNEERNQSAVLLKSSLFDEVSRPIKLPTSTDSEMSTRMAYNVVKYKSRKMVFISYHGPRDPENAAKSAEAFFKLVEDKFDKTIPVLIGGDFNTDISKLPDRLDPDISIFLLDPDKYQISEYEKVWPRNGDKREKIDFIVLRKPTIEGLRVELEDTRAIVYSTLPKINFLSQLSDAFSSLKQQSKSAKKDVIGALDHSYQTGQEQDYIERAFSQLDIKIKIVKKDCMWAVDNSLYKSDPPVGDEVTNHSPLVATLNIERRRRRYTK